MSQNKHGISEKIMPGQSVLIVEDEGLIALQIAEILAYEGYFVLPPESSGEDVLHSLEKTPRPDIILMDIGLSGKMDGIETARQIKMRYGIPIIFLTAYSDESRTRRAREISGNNFILKPCTEIDLVTALRKIASRSTPTPL